MVLVLCTSLLKFYICSTFQKKNIFDCFKVIKRTLFPYLKLQRVFVVMLLFYVHGKHLWSCRDGQLT